MEAAEVAHPDNYREARQYKEKGPTHQCDELAPSLYGGTPK
jgi:hypothetical protein